MEYINKPSFHKQPIFRDIKFTDNNPQDPSKDPVDIFEKNSVFDQIRLTLSLRKCYINNDFNQRKEIK